MYICMYVRMHPQDEYRFFRMLQENKHLTNFIAHTLLWVIKHFYTKFHVNRVSCFTSMQTNRLSDLYSSISKDIMYTVVQSFEFEL